MQLRALLVTALLASFGAAAFAAEATKSESSEKARLVFMRIKQGVGIDLKADLLEVVAGQPQFIARLAQSEKLILQVAPGPKQFMTIGFGGSSNFLYADLLPGKTYYVVLQVHGGTGGITPVPVRADSHYQEDSPMVVTGLRTYKLVTPTRADQEDFARERNSSSVQAFYERATKASNRRNSAERAERTIHPEDSVSAASAQLLAPAGAPAIAVPVSTPVPASAPAQVQQSGKVDSQAARRLEELKVLRDRGLITNDEYQEKRKAILRDL